MIQLSIRFDRHVVRLTFIETKRRRSDPVLWQKPLHQQKCQKGKVTTQTTLQKSSIKQQLRTDLGRSVGVTTATQLVWLTWFTGPPSHSHINMDIVRYRWYSRLERESSKREVVGSSPAVCTNFSFCNFRFLRVAHSSYQPMQMKSTVTYT